MAKSQQNEDKVKSEIQAFLTELGAFHFKVHGNIFMRVGLPDIICCLHGLFIGIEVKDGNNEPSEIQLAQGRRITKAGGIFIVAWSVQDVKDALIKHNLI